MPALLVAFAGIVLFTYIFNSVPLPSGLEATATVIYDSNGNELGTLQPEGRREDVPLASLPDHVKHAVLAAEDAQFYRHRGVSIAGIFRAAYRNVVAGQVAQGGSTISQQYIKNVTEDDERTALRKVREAALAFKLEQRYSKDQIFEFYLNSIYFGRGAYGIQAAAEAYYGKDAADLTPAEAAQLAGIIPSPSRLDPRENKEGATRRYRYVLDRLVANGWMSGAEAGRLAYEEPVPLERQSVQSHVAPWFLQIVQRELEDRLGADRPDRIYQGLQVTTTLNLGVQRHAEAAFAEHFGPLDEKVGGSIVAVDPVTGGIRAVVGGRDFAKSQVSMATAKRQPGSTFKVFSLAAWMADGRSPESFFEAPRERTYAPEEVGGTRPWPVSNYGGAEFEPMTLRQATWRSVNTVYAEVLKELGLEKVSAAARAAGIPLKPEEELPSQVLGGVAVTPLQLAEAYTTFATGGVHRDAFSVLEVRRGDTVIYTARRTERRVFSEQVANLTTDVLRGVITSGTGTRAQIGRPAAGKTGTTNNSADAWFAGYTPALTAVVTMGHVDDNEPMAGGPTGGELPAEAWATFMRAALEGVPAQEFPRATDAGLVVENAALEPSPTPTPACPPGQVLVEGDGEEVADECVDEEAEPEPSPSESPSEDPQAEPGAEPTGEPTGAPAPQPTGTAPATPAPTPSQPQPQPSPTPTPPPPSPTPASTPPPQSSPPASPAAEPATLLGSDSQRSTHGGGRPDRPGREGPGG